MPQVGHGPRRREEQTVPGDDEVLRPARAVARHQVSNQLGPRGSAIAAPQLSSGRRGTLEVDEPAQRRPSGRGFLNEYKNRGGRVTAGSDSGFIFQLYGFAYIRELELLREAGFHPLEVIRSATLNGAEALGWDDKIGSVQIGKMADFVIVEENPLENLKVLYGTGAIKLTEDNEVVRVGGVKYTIKDGIIYDAKQLLAQVKQMVDDAKAAEGFELKQPGIKD